MRHCLGLNLARYTHLLLIAAAFIVAIGCPTFAVADRPRTPYPDDGAVIEQELVKLGVAIDTPSVLSAAAQGDEGVQMFAVKLLGYRAGRGAEVVLRQRMEEDQSPVIRQEAALSLIRLGHFDVVDDARKQLVAEEEPRGQLYLAGQLARLGEPFGYEYVAEAANSEDEGLRYFSAGALADFALADFKPPAGHAAPADLLAELLADESVEVRAEALLQIGLARGRGLDVVRYLKRIREMAASDPQPMVREQAAGWLAVQERIDEGGR